MSKIKDLSHDEQFNSFRTVPERVQFFFFGLKKTTKTTGTKTKVPAGIYTGRVAVRSSGHFDVKTKDAKITVSHKYCKPTHLMDGYSYA